MGDVKTIKTAPWTKEVDVEDEEALVKMLNDIYDVYSTNFRKFTEDERREIYSRRHVLSEALFKVRGYECSSDLSSEDYFVCPKCHTEVDPEAKQCSGCSVTLRWSEVEM